MATAAAVVGKLRGHQRLGELESVGGQVAREHPWVIERGIGGGWSVSVEPGYQRAGMHAAYGKGRARVPACWHACSVRQGLGPETRSLACILVQSLCGAYVRVPHASSATIERAK